MTVWLPLSIPNTTLLNAYDASTTFGQGDVFAWGFFTVANNPAFVQLFEGVRGQGVFQPEVYCPPATYPIAGGERPISGIRARRLWLEAVVTAFALGGLVILWLVDEPERPAPDPEPEPEPLRRLVVGPRFVFYVDADGRAWLKRRAR